MVFPCRIASSMHLGCGLSSGKRKKSQATASPVRAILNPVFWFVYFYTPVYFETLTEEKYYLSGQYFSRNIPKFINKLLKDLL